MTAKTLRRIATTLVAILVAAFLAEWGFRAVTALGVVEPEIWPFVPVEFDQVIHRYSDDPELVYECRPGAATEKDGVAIRTNAAGFRDDEFALPPDPDRPRVAILGDSVGFASQVPVEEAFAHLLEVRSAGEPPALDVLNFSVTGYNSDQERRLLDTTVLRYSPRVILLAYVMNDVTPTDGIGVMCRAAHPAMPGPRLHSRLWIYLQHRIEKRGFWRARTTDRPARLFDRLAELEGADGPRTLVAVFPQLDEPRTGWNRPEEYDQILSLIRERGLRLVDLRAEMEARASGRIADLYHDRTHLSAAGHAFAASVLLRELRAMHE